MYIPAEKTRNLYKMDPDVHGKLLRENITNTYKSTSASSVVRINMINAEVGRSRKISESQKEWIPWLRGKHSSRWKIIRRTSQTNTMLTHQSSQEWNGSRQQTHPGQNKQQHQKLCVSTNGWTQLRSLNGSTALGTKTSTPSSASTSSTSIPPSRKNSWRKPRQEAHQDLQAGLRNNNAPESRCFPTKDHHRLKGMATVYLTSPWAAMPAWKYVN